MVHAESYRETSVISSAARDIYYHLERLHYDSIVSVEDNTDGTVTLCGHGKEGTYNAKQLTLALTNATADDFDNQLHLVDFLDAFSLARRKKGIGNCGFRMVRAIERALEILEVFDVQVYGNNGRVDLVLDNKYYMGNYHPETLLQQLLMDDGGYGMYNGYYLWNLVVPAQV